MADNTIWDKLNLKLFSNKKFRNISLFIASLLSCLLIFFIVIPLIYPYNPHSVRATNLTPTSVTISWVTSKPTKGRVYVSHDNIDPNFAFLVSKTDTTFNKLIDSTVNAQSNFSSDEVQVFIDDRTENSVEPTFYTHHVTINNLQPDTEYSFKISDGFILADYKDADQSREWFDPPTLLSFNFETPSQIENIEEIRLPSQAYGDIKFIGESESSAQMNIMSHELFAQDNSSEISDSSDFQDILLFINAYQGDNKGNRSETMSSQYLSTTADSLGNWVIDKTSFRDSSGQFFSELKNNQDFLYVYLQAKNETTKPGEYYLVGTQDSPVPTRFVSTKTVSISDSSLNSQNSRINLANGIDLSESKNPSNQNNSNSNNQSIQLSISSNKNYQNDQLSRNNKNDDNLIVKKANAQSTGMCCILEIEGRNDLIGDWEDGDYCNSCQSCFFGKKKYDGLVTWTYTESTISDEKTCQKSYAKSAYEQIKIQQNELAQVAQEYGCNPNAPTTSVDGLISRDDFAKLAYTQYGITLPTDNKLNKAYTCFNHVVCRSVSKGVDPAIVLSLWLGHSAGGNSEIIDNSYSEFGVKTDISKQDFDAQLSSILSQISGTKCSSITDPFVRLSTTLISPSKCDQNTANTYYFPALSLVSEINLSPIEHSEKLSEIWTKISTNPQPKSSFEIDEIACDYTENYIKPVESEDSVCCAIKTLSSENVIGQWTAKSSDCSKWKIGTTFDGSDIEYVTQVDIKSKSSCDYQEFTYTCEGDGVKLSSTTIGQSNGSISSCIKGVSYHPVQDNTQKPHIDISKLTVFTNYSLESGILEIKEKGTYLITVDSTNYAYIVSDKAQKHRFYKENLSKYGYQQSDEIVIPTQNSKIYKIFDTSEIAFESNFNFISFNFQPTFDGTNNITAGQFLMLANTNGLIVKSITKFSDGKWENGVIYNPNVSSGFIGNDYTLQSGVGYVVTLYPDILDSNATQNTTTIPYVADGKAVVVVPSKALQGPSKISFAQGWNLVGVNGFKQNYQASGLLKNINMSDKVLADNISYWNPKSSRYNTVSIIGDSEYGIDYQLLPENSYFIRITNIKSGNPSELWSE
ncbi:MAG TPA: fibronectin type III domain-containing protein [Candidatus Dojkabacteria bacterium]|nr:fibronectin type III domain-containing protein [Candidatus Dojkabacteria bacterium]